MKYYTSQNKNDSGQLFMEMPVVRSARIEALRNMLIDAVPQICSDRARLLTEAYQKNNSDPTPVKRAKAYAHILENMKINMLDNELIVGALGTKPRTAPIFPEFATDWLIEEFDGNPMRTEDRPGDRYVVDAEDEKVLRELHGYWHGNNHQARCEAVMPEETAIAKDIGVTDSTWLMTGGEGHVVVDLRGVVEKGLNDVIRRAEERLAALDIVDPEQEKQRDFLKAVIIVNKAVIRFANRYAELAREKAAVEKDALRKQELLKIADVCEHVPANPARDFHEGVQAMWFINLTLQLENNGHSISFGRFDQTLNALYEKSDGQDGFSYMDALELVECLFLKVFQLLKITSWENTKAFAGYQLFQNITVGGQDKNGKDSTNELTYLVLNAQAAISLNTPSISLRYHNRINERAMYAAFDVVRIGGGQPALYSDEVYIPALVNRGIPWDDAVNYSIVGCVEAIVEGKQTGRPNGAGFVNLARIMELALYNGKDPESGNAPTIA